LVSNGLVRRLAAAAGIVLSAALVACPAAAWPWRTRPRPDSLEYQRNWGLDAIGASAAYAAGWSGKGVRIGLVDCGVGRRGANLGRNLSRESADVVPVRAAHFADRHGALVAEPLAARLDGEGVVGVAYNATLIEIRADMDGGYNGECAFWPADVARALDYAVDHRARIVVLPLQAKHPLGEAFETALRRAADAGVVLVVAAGNDRLADPAWPARYAADPRFAADMVVAGASSLTGEMVAWSNRAGATAARYVLAPGEWIMADCQKHCQLASGTSFATPFVAGAIALMMQAHPELSGPQAADRVLAAARPLGPAEVYGRGMLDLRRAFPSPAAAS
jgi:subtilisin family serine protease